MELGQIPQRHANLGASDTDAAYEDATHAVLHVSKDTFNPCPYAGLGFVADFLAFAQWLASVGALVDLTGVFTVFEALFLLF